MGEEVSFQVFHDMNLMKKIDGNNIEEVWCNNNLGSENSIESSFDEDSENSISSSSISSSDLVEDASSSSSSASSSNGPLYELSEIMDQLPIKLGFFFFFSRRGLSKHYQGKSQSFTSLASVKSLEDLPKKVIPFKGKMKSCKSYGWGLADAQKQSSYSPKASISKKGSRGCFMSSIGKRSLSTLVITE
ncbi:hypothetical protein COLO4_34724 [Corchorus olitorius]|uniref:Oxidative stress 3 n=1 Tax=Corchorus olitorius TaxID=93759 RepID=A0A1R3GJZ6_9ROSI|nr:hypothetical protein COLO4_34724 [Corchorus olitorius]